METIPKLESFKARLIQYLKLKTEQEDWHGVSDAANDIREIEAKLSVLREQDSKVYVRVQK